MFQYLCLAFCITFVACGSSGNSTFSASSSWAIQNPNFDDGLAAWNVTGLVDIVAIDGIPNINHAASLQLDDNISATISQEIKILTATNLGIGYWQASSNSAMVLTSVTLNGNHLVTSGQTASSDFRSGLHVQAHVEPGILNVALYIDPSASPEESSASVTGFFLIPDAPEAISTVPN